MAPAVSPPRDELTAVEQQQQRQASSPPFGDDGDVVAGRSSGSSDVQRWKTTFLPFPSGVACGCGGSGERSFSLCRNVKMEHLDGPGISATPPPFDVQQQLAVETSVAAAVIGSSDSPCFGEPVVAEDQGDILLFHFFFDVSPHVKQQQRQASSPPFGDDGDVVAGRSSGSSDVQRWKTTFLPFPSGVACGCGGSGERSFSLCCNVKAEHLDGPGISATPPPPFDVQQQLAVETSGDPSSVRLWRSVSTATDSPFLSSVRGSSSGGNRLL
nr:hypothetical protein Iba_chr10eCG11530 [Ipomoea batatas]